jgi:hypothetical protein
VLTNTCTLNKIKRLTSRPESGELCLFQDQVIVLGLPNEMLLQNPLLGHHHPELE